MQIQMSKYRSVASMRSQHHPETITREQSLSEIVKETEPTYGDEIVRPCPFNIRWIHGYNPKVGIINLNKLGSSTVMYAASNCAVLYNWTTNQMKILQGHIQMSKYRSVASMRSQHHPETITREQSLSEIVKETEPTYGDEIVRPCPFNIRWIHGYNPKVGIINLNKLGSSTVMYAASNCAVLYNWTTNQMKILQGHCNFVSCIAVDKNGKWLVTADSGPDNVVIVWDNDRCMPCRTLFSPHGNVKIAKVAISGDAKYLLTLGFHEKAVIHWWIWSFGLEIPHATTEVDMREPIIMMDFDPENCEHFVLISKHDLYIGSSKKVVIEDVDASPNDEETFRLDVVRTEKKFAPDMGVFTYFTFVPATSQVLVTTSGGCVAVYGYTMEYNKNADSSNIENLKCVKVLKIEKYRINVIKCVDDTVITGNQEGEIRFYDDQLKLLYWCHAVHVDCVKGLGFNLTPRSYELINPKCNKYCECCERFGPDVNPFTGDIHQKLIQKKIPSDATTLSKPFIVRDFLIQTDNEGIGYVNFAYERYKTILDYRKYYVSAMSVHVEKPLFSVGYVDGTVELVNYELHKVFAKRDLRDQFKIVIPPKEDSIKSAFEIIIPSLSVTCLKYSPSGMHLACGLNDGQLLFLDPLTLALLTKTPFKDTSHTITDICYSCDSMTLAFADKGYTVCVYSYNCEKFEWSFIGKHRSHYKEIISLFFTTWKNPDDFYKLISVGLDRAMIEYDIGKSKNECLEVMSLDRIEQAAIPLYCMEWPIPKGVDSDIPTLLFVNDEFKYKVINCSTTMTLGTFLGPRYEDPVRKTILINKKYGGGDQLDYLLYCTKKIIGLQKMPLDGNPYKHVAVLCHPKEILIMNFREDIDTLFVLGKKDNSVSQWEANYTPVEITTIQGGGDLDPFYCLIEGGRPGWLFLEMRDLFYYIQILCQGTFSPAIRRVGDFIPIESLPDIMRALGYFPSEFDVENMLIHAKYNVYDKTPATLIGFDDFVKLYLNHRPAFGDNISKVRSSFRNFTTVDGKSMVITRQEFIDMLTNYGECYSRELAWYLLSILSGHTFDDRAVMIHEDFSFLPEVISYADFVNDIMGIQEVDVNLSELQSLVSSMDSQQTGSTLTHESSDDNVSR